MPMTRLSPKAAVGAAIVFSLLIVLSGCAERLQTRSRAPDSQPGSQQGKAAGSTPSSAPRAHKTGRKLPRRTGTVPACNPDTLAIDGYKPVLQQYADLDGDAVDECIIGYQYERTDEMGEPEEIAYLTLAKYRGRKWEEWLSVPAPAGEKYCEEDSLVAARDVNQDGLIELIVRFYGFGVSSRPATVYVWQVAEDGLRPAIESEFVETSSGDKLVLRDVRPELPGDELVFSIAQPGREPATAPHRYRVVVYGWSDGQYRSVWTHTTQEAFATAEAALDTALRALRAAY